MLQYDDKVISISDIDTTDDTCCLSLHSDLAPLIASIQAIGLINLPVLRNKDNSTYLIVCGFRRIKACESLGWHEIKVRVLMGDLSEHDLLKLAILDNRSHRPLNIVEQARGIEKLSTHRSANSLETLSSLLGFPPNQKVFQKISALGRLPEVIQAGVLDHSISFEAAVDLSEFSAKDALSLLDLLKELKLSQNKQKAIITLVREIAIREDLRFSEVLQSEEVRGIMDEPKFNRNEKGSKLRAYLKRRRFPSLARAEQRFLKELKALKLDEHFHITLPANFESGSYTLRITFKSLKDLDHRRQSLDAIIRNPAMRRLLDPQSF
jgi:ParB/RepB/Spo0J family partition protein